MDRDAGEGRPELGWHRCLLQRSRLRSDAHVAHRVAAAGNRPAYRRARLARTPARRRPATAPTGREDARSRCRDVRGGAVMTSLARPTSSHRAPDRDFEPWSGPKRPYDLVKEFTVALVVVTLLTVLLSLIHISEPTRRTPISYAVFCLKK